MLSEIDLSATLHQKLGVDLPPQTILGACRPELSHRALLADSFNGPYKSSFDAYARNAVNAWWQDSCVTGRTRCAMHADGTPNFQGTIAHGLYEFRPEEARRVTHFLVNTYLKSACQAPFDIGC